MNCARKYTYPDFNDKITDKMIDTYNPNDTYWQDSEKQILNLIKNYIMENVNGKERWFLDAGCGDGRLLPEFQVYFDNMVAIDPDALRIKKAKDLIEKLGLSSKITLQAITIEEFQTEEKFDVILCSHVLQHVRTGLVPVILDNFRAKIKDKGLLFLTTCHSSRGYDYFVKDFLEGSKLLEVEITREEFNSLVDGLNTLPIHFLSQGEIYRLLDESNFQIIDFNVFHILEKDMVSESSSNLDIHVNSDPQLQLRMGRDMLIVAKPK